MTSRDADNGQGGRDFAIGLRSGIFDRKHFRAIGVALWTFAWCIDRQTDDTGRVLGGRILSYQEIAAEVGLETAEQARHQIRTLVAGGYLSKEAYASGVTLRITAPKKARLDKSGAHRRGVSQSPALTAGGPALTAAPIRKDSGETQRDSRSIPSKSVSLTAMGSNARALVPPPTAGAPRTPAAHPENGRLTDGLTGDLETKGTTKAAAKAGHP